MKTLAMVPLLTAIASQTSFNQRVTLYIAYITHPKQLVLYIYRYHE